MAQNFATSTRGRRGPQCSRRGAKEERPARSRGSALSSGGPPSSSSWPASTLSGSPAPGKLRGGSRGAPSLRLYGELRLPTLRPRPYTRPTQPWSSNRFRQIAPQRQLLASAADLPRVAVQFSDASLMGKYRDLLRLAEGHLHTLPSCPQRSEKRR